MLCIARSSDDIILTKQTDQGVFIAIFRVFLFCILYKMESMKSVKYNKGKVVYKTTLTSVNLGIIFIIMIADSSDNEEVFKTFIVVY